MEFAFIAPLLILLALGIAEFGRAFQVQGTLSAAAREGVRSMALQNNQGTARATARSRRLLAEPGAHRRADHLRAGHLPDHLLARHHRQGHHQLREPFLTGAFGAGVNLTATGVMRCDG